MTYMSITKTKEKVRDAFLGDLPPDLQTEVMNIHKLIKDTVRDILDEDNYEDLKKSSWAKSCIDEFCAMPKDKSEIGSVRVYKKGKTYRCMIQATGHFTNHQYGWIEELLHDFIGNVYATVRPKIRRQYDMTITNEGRTGQSFEGFDIYPNPKVVRDIWDSLEGRKTKTITESVNFLEKETEYMKESTPASEYNVSMSEREAKKTLATLSQSIINDIANKKGNKVVTQYTANIYANIITKNLLPLWAKGFRKFSITLDSYQSFCTFEFKVPNMTQDFVARFVNGRESLNGFIHRQSEIKVKMSPNIFHTMKDANDAYSFFKAAIKYYDSSLERYGNKMMIDVLKLNHEMKHLISTTKLSGIVVYPLSLLFKFDDVKMDDRDVFRITQEDVKTISQFMRSIYTRYADPNKERKRIVDDVQEMVKALREYSDIDDENMKSLTHFPEAVDMYLSGGFDEKIESAHESWILEHIDFSWNSSNPEVQYLQEKFGVKKLKKIPSDLVAYISIEAEAIKDANDKMMISSYCLGKIEIVEWYIELLDVGSKKYIVPHTKPYLEGVRTQLLACFKKIMDTPIPKKDRPLIDIQYPKGYEG